MYRRKILLVTSLILTLAASSSAWAQNQYARPDQTISSGTWTAEPVQDHYLSVDDEPSFDDADYIDSGSNDSTIQFRLSSFSDPGTGIGFTLRYRCRSLGGSGGPERCNADLYQGATLVATTGNISASRGTFAEVPLALTQLEGESIVYNATTNLPDPPLEVHISSSVGNGELVQVSWIELEAPPAAVVAPVLGTPTASPFDDTTATLNGSVTDDSGTPATDCGFDWDSDQSGEPYANSQSFDAGSCDVGQSFSLDLTGLTPNTQYWYRAWATNGSIGYSTEESFTTDPAATVPILAADDPPGDITSNSATLGGSISDDGGDPPTDCGVEWDSDAPGPPYTFSQSYDAGTCAAGQGFTAAVTGLSPFTTYWYRAWSTNSAGTGFSSNDVNDVTFQTLPGLPVVATRTPNNVAATSADLGGDVTSNGGETPVSVGIVWNTTNTWNTGQPPASNGNDVPAGSIDSGPFETLVDLTGQTGNTVHFRAYATNSIGTGYSDPQSFTPSEPPTVTVTAASLPSITSDSALLGGNVTNENGAAVTSRGIVWNTTNVWNPSNPPASEGTVWQMGSGPGAFSATVTELPSTTLIYYKAFAINARGTSYSTATEQFTTLAKPEPTVQASSIIFDRVSAKAMTVKWTRGDGDGSIVVMRQGVVKVDPVDGNDYAPDSDYSIAPELPTGSGNFVVHKGPGSTVWVTGLALNTTYDVAVYEYSNSGTDIDYLTDPPPVQDSRSTTTVPSHNVDLGINCNECHYHGSFNSRGDELKTICANCHNLDGVAKAKLMFDNHTPPSDNPDVDFVDCGTCHEVHLDGEVNTTVSTSSITGATQPNKSYLRANVNDQKHVPTAAGPAFLHNDQPKREAGNVNNDPEQAANTPDRAVEGGDATTARGYCQVCHTLTNYHRSTADAPGIPTGDPRCHDGNSNDSCGEFGIGGNPVQDPSFEVHCGDCHEHDNQFQGVGGAVSCVVCHADKQPDPVNGPRPVITTMFDRNSTHISGGSSGVTQEDCEVCHDQSTHNQPTNPEGQKIRVLNADNGLSYAQATKNGNTLDEGAAFTPHCLSCHDANGASNLPAYTGDTAGQTDFSPFEGSGAPKEIDATDWAASAHDDAALSCAGNGVNGCHGSGHGSNQNNLLAPAEGAAVSLTTFCFSCHDGGVAATDVQTEFDNLAVVPNVDPVGSQSGALGLDNYHDLAQVSCGNCHSPHVDNTSGVLAVVGDPDTAIPVSPYSPLGSYNEDNKQFNYYSATSDLDPVNPEGSAGGFTEPDYIQFCLACHDGTVPTGSGITMTANLINMADAWSPVGANNTDVHGIGAPSGQGSSTNKGGMKEPWVTAADAANNWDPTGPYAAMNCTTCHGAHGTGNIYNLRTSISVGGVQLSVGGVGANAGIYDPARTPDPTVYTLPPLTTGGKKSIDTVNGVQTDHYWGAWCSFCHKMDGHPGKVETDSCTNGHMHGGGAF